MAAIPPRTFRDGHRADAATVGAKRRALVLAARSWVGCPYHHRARVRGAGIDCAYVLIEPAVAAELIYDFDPVPYPPDWMLHRDEERYLETLELFTYEIDPGAGLLPGDVVVFRYGRTFSHSALVSGDPRSAELTGWPWAIHAYAASRVVEEAYLPGTPMADGRAMKAFRLRGIDD